MEKEFHGFYSAQANMEQGHCIYINEAGEETKVTAVYYSKEQGEKNYNWPDAIYMGKLVSFVRSTASLTYKSPMVSCKS